MQLESWSDLNDVADAQNIPIFCVRLVIFFGLSGQELSPLLLERTPTVFNLKETTEL